MKKAGIVCWSILSAIAGSRGRRATTAATTRSLYIVEKPKENTNQQPA